MIKAYTDLNINEKIRIKQYAINLNGKRWHTKRPDFIKVLNPLQIHTVLTSKF